VQQGFDPRDFALVAFGGAGPLHANALGKLTGAWPVIIPPSPGVLCAYGDATTMVRDEAARTSIRRFGALSDGELRELLGELAETAATTVEEQGVPRGQQVTTYQVDLRYHGQGFEITVPVDAAVLDGADGGGTGGAGGRAGLDALAAAFDAEHSRLFSFLLDGNEHELVSARATVTGPRPDVGTVRLPDGGPDPAAALRRTIRIWVDGAHADAAEYDRTALRAGNVVTGPAVITEMDSTTLVLPGHAATVHPSGSLLIRPVEG
jgi:N-methylhydantoinase A